MTGETTRKNLNAERGRCLRNRKGEEGQTIVLVLLALGIFLLATVALAVDFTHLWVRQQLAQTAADSACVAGVMDMLSLAGDGVVTTANFNPPTPFTCSNTNLAAPTTTKTPCWYAAANGFTSPGLTTNAVSNVVSYSFPSISDCPSGANCPVPGVTPITGSSNLPVGWASNSVLHTQVTDRSSVSFLRLFGGAPTRDVSAGALCGIIGGSYPSPITILHPTVSRAFDLAGGGIVYIKGGPSRSIQVNSNNTSSNSAMMSSMACAIDISQGGPTYSGGTIGVVGSAKNGSATCGFNTYCPTCTLVEGSSPMPDPFRNVAIPSNTGMPTGVSADVASTVDGCPDTRGCRKYSPGYYASGITVSGSGSETKTAIFEPGIYFLEGDLTLGNNSCLRPATTLGDGSKGVTFYFSGADHTVQGGADGVADCAPASGGSPAQVISDYTIANSKCAVSSVLPPGLPSTVAGSVLLGPCNAPTETAVCTPNCSLDYSDPQGASNPAGIQRGFLFFQSRTHTLSNPHQPIWRGGGSFYLAGFMYFHHTSFTHSFEFKAAATSYFNGAIITDAFKISGNSALYMYLPERFGYQTLKASLFR